MRRIMLAGTALVALSVTSPLWAQAQAPTPAADNGSPTDIVVTAQKRPERMKDIPVAASVVSSAILANNNATDITDLNKLVPSVEMKGTFNGRVPLGIRGISTNANEAAVGLTSGVAIEIDGVPVPPDSFAANQLDDVTQIEVLKGPQATLGGRTASAGVINIVTGSPSKTFKGKISGEVTNDGEQRINAAISGPITKGISFSLSGFDTHVTYPIYNLTTGLQSDSTNVGVRGKLKFEITPDFDATIMGRYSKFKGNGDNFTHQYISPGAALFPFIDGVGISQAQAFPGMSAYYGNMNTTAAGPDMYAVWEDTDASLTLNYRAGDLTFSSTTAYQKEKQNQLQHVAESAVYFFNVLTGGMAPPWYNNQLINNDVKQFTQEFKVASDTHKPVSFLAGAFYSNNEVDNNQARQWVANDEGFLTISKTKTYAAYARVTGKIAENTSITGGLRYNHDEIYFQKTQFFDPSGTPVYWMGCHKITTVHGPATTGPTCVLPANSSSSDTLVGDISVQQHFGKDQMVYASYTRGYKPAAYNTAQDFFLPLDNPSNLPISTLTLTPAGKETIDSYEIGAKLTLLDRKVTLNLAAFNTTYNGYQVQIFPIVNGGLSPLQLLNAGKARTQGIEADLDLRPAPDTHIAISAAYIDAKFVSFQNAPCYPTQTLAQGCASDGTQDLSGHSMPDAPKFKLDVDLEQRFPLGSSELVLGSNIAYRTSANFQANGDPYTAQPGFAIVNLSAGVDFQHGKYNLTGFVNNVFNKFYLTNAEDFFSGLFAQPGTLAQAQAGTLPTAADAIGQPARDAKRYVGARFTAKF